MTARGTSATSKMRMVRRHRAVSLAGVIEVALPPRWRTGGGAGTAATRTRLGAFGPVRHDDGVLIAVDVRPQQTAGTLTDGRNTCPHKGCDGQLRCWGYARTRCVRVIGEIGETHRPHHGRCRRRGRFTGSRVGRVLPRRVAMRPAVSDTVASSRSRRRSVPVAGRPPAGMGGESDTADVRLISTR